MWEGSGAEMRSKRLKNENSAKLCALLGSILEVKIGQKSIKTDINFEITFWKTFFMDFQWIWDLFLKLFLIKMAIKVEKGDFMKNL